MPKKNLVLLQVFKTVLLKSMVVVLFTWLDDLPNSVNITPIFQQFIYFPHVLIYFALQDFSKDHMDRVGYEIYTIMDINLLTPLHLIYAENSSDSGKVRDRAI